MELGQRSITSAVEICLAHPQLLRHGGIHRDFSGLGRDLNEHQPELEPATLRTAAAEAQESERCFDLKALRLPLQLSWTKSPRV
jgi:hypothetical protein